MKTMFVRIFFIFYFLFLLIVRIKCWLSHVFLTGVSQHERCYFYKCTLNKLYITVTTHFCLFTILNIFHSFLLYYGNTHFFFRFKSRMCEGCKWTDYISLKNNWRIFTRHPWRIYTQFYKD